MRRSSPKAPSAAAFLTVVLAACGGGPPPPKPAPPPPPPADPPIVAQVAEACARLSACTSTGDAGRFRDPGACVDWWLGVDPSRPDALRSCLAAAKSCDEVATCMRGRGDARIAAFCAQRAGVVAGCEGERLVSCSGDDAQASTVTDCAAMGATCREAKSAGGLVLRACWSSELCPSGAPETRCDGPGAVLSCRDGAVDRIACPPGTECSERKDESGETVASCELPGSRRCEALGVRHCEQNRLVECDRSATFGAARIADCDGFGLRCAGVGPRAGCFVPTNAECERELLPRCDGDSLVYCVAGRLAKVSCTALGLGPCDPSAKGAIAGCTVSRAASGAATGGSGEANAP